MLVKNDLHTVDIDSLSSDGNGVCRVGGVPVFVPFSAPGDRAHIRIVKVKKSFAYGIIESIVSPSADRADPPCPAFSRCGGCCFQHISYPRELEEKRKFAENALRRIGGLDIRVDRMLSAGETGRYRNKVQFPVCGNPPVYGLYAPRSHRIVPCADCLLQPALLNRVAACACDILTGLGATGYDEASRSGEVRHLLIRCDEKAQSVLVCLVANAVSLPWESEFASRLSDMFPQIKTVCLNSNMRDTNVILGETTRALTGPGYITDRLCGVPVRIDTHSFYQVNHAAAELLYGEIKRLASLTGRETVLDLYCGAGTIGLSLAGGIKRLIGVEIVKPAVESARAAAEELGIQNCEFILSDSGTAAERLVRRGEKIDLAITDPPRSGCDQLTLDSLITLSPERIVMVSCEPATAARDIKYLCAHGYSAVCASAADLFPRTEHVECAVLLARADR